MIKHDQAYFRSRRDRHARGSHEAPLLQCRCTCSPPNRLQRVTLLCADIASQLRVLQKEVTVLPERGHAHRQGLSAERGSKASRPSLSPQGAASSRRTATALLHLQSTSQNSKYHPSPPVGVPLLSLRSHAQHASHLAMRCALLRRKHRTWGCRHLSRQSFRCGSGTSRCRVLPILPSPFRAASGSLGELQESGQVSDAGDHEASGRFASCEMCSA